MLDGMCLNGVLMFFMIGGPMISEITWVIILFFFSAFARRMGYPWEEECVEDVSGKQK